MPVIIYVGVLYCLTLADDVMDRNWIHRNSISASAAAAVSIVPRGNGPSFFSSFYGEEEEETKRQKPLSLSIRSSHAPPFNPISDGRKEGHENLYQCDPILSTTFPFRPWCQMPGIWAENPGGAENG